jgi:hypothetical protein
VRGLTNDASRRRASRAALLRRLLAEPGTGSSEPAGFTDWALRVPEPRSGRLNFELFPFQREMYAEGAAEREGVVMKSTQIGVSAWASRWALYQSDVLGRTGLYVFPTQRDVHDFSTARIKRLFDASDYLRGRQRATDPSNKGLVGIGGGMVYFRGSQARRGLDAVDADYVVFDEYDMLAHENIPDAERRVTGPLSAGLIRRVGVPTIPGWGIARLFDESDQRRWRVKCGACGDWQTIDFDRNVDTATATRVCAACRNSLDVGAGEWVADFPDRDVRGYHVTRLIAPTADIGAIIAASRKRTGYERQAFFNKDLGVPWAPEEGRLSLAALLAAQSLAEFVMSENYAGDNLVTMGVDVASTRALHVRISEHLPRGRKKGIFIGEVDDFIGLERLMERFRVRMAAIDHLPEGRLARAFVERFPGRAYVVAYNTAVQPRGADVINVHFDMRFATVQRLAAIDATTEMIRQQRNLLPLDLPDDYIDHLQALVRSAEQDPLGNQHVTYHATGPDDYAQAEVYDLLAGELWQLQQNVDDASRETFVALDELVEFPRSRLSDLDDPYVPGPREPDFDDYEYP